MAFLERVRPGAERLVDQLLSYEELSGKELKSLLKEYISTVGSLEILCKTQESALFNLVIQENKLTFKKLQKSIH